MLIMYVLIITSFTSKNLPDLGCLNAIEELIPIINFTNYSYEIELSIIDWVICF
jgi:hypothetical protein